MSKYFEAKIKYRKTTETGVQKIVTESYIVDALSFTEAEANITEQMKIHISEEFRVTNIKVTNYSEIVASEDADVWFKAKVSLIAYDEESGKEKKTNIYLLVSADDAKDAYDKTVGAMSTTMGGYTVPSVSETNIVEVFQYLGDE